MTGCCAVALVTCAFAPTDNSVTVASTPAVQPRLASNRASASSVMNKRNTAVDWAPACSPNVPPCVRWKLTVLPPLRRAPSPCHAPNDEPGLEHGREHQHTPRPADQLLGAWILAVQIRQRVVDAGIDGLATGCRIAATRASRRAARGKHQHAHQRRHEMSLVHRQYLLIEFQSR